MSNSSFSPFLIPISSGSGSPYLPSPNSYIINSFLNLRFSFLHKTINNINNINNRPGRSTLSLPSYPALSFSFSSSSSSSSMALTLARSRLLTHFLRGKIEALSLPNLIPISFNSSLPHGNDTCTCTGGSLSNTRNFCSLPHAAPSVEANEDKGSISQVLDFPGGKVAFVAEMRFLAESPKERISCYRVLDDSGQTMSGSRFKEVGKDLARKMYSDMVTLQIMDTIFYEAQRQGRISFYLTSFGEEAINIASAAALSQDDVVLPQGARGVTVARFYFARVCKSMLWQHARLWERPPDADPLWNILDDLRPSKDREIKLPNIFEVTYFEMIMDKIFDFKFDNVSTQLPHAVGAAYSLKMDKKNACSITYFGDGGTSEGDFHAALNFAAVLEVPVIFFCRNNGWAISTPITDQFRCDGAVIRGQAYGIRSIRVDGNDALAVYSAVHAAREMAVSEGRPILVEALTYRVGHHSTSDDSTKYRPIDEIEHWRIARDPISRYRKWVEGNGWWSDAEESELRSNVRKELLQAIQVAERMKKPPLRDLFTDVYDQVPNNLRDQEKLLRQTIKKHPADYPSDIPL